MTGFLAPRINTIPSIAMLTPIVLDATTESLTVIVPSGIIATNPDYTIDFIETTPTTYEEFSNDGTIAGSGAETTLVSAPASGVKRIILSFRINNRDSVQQVVQLNVKNGANTRRVWTGILKTSETLTPNGVFDFGGNIKTAGSGGGSGGVTSVGLSLPSDFTVSGTPILGAGTLTAIWASVAANKILSGPTTGAATIPTFRSLVVADFASLVPFLFIEEKTAASSATLDFTLPSGYRFYVAVIRNIKPATDGASLWLRFSTDGGGSFLATSTYGYHTQDSTGGAATYAAVASNGAAQIVLSGEGVGNAADESINGDVNLLNMDSAVNKKNETHSMILTNVSSNPVLSQGVGDNDTTLAVNAVRFLFSAGNVASGTIALYGIL